jgi:hypothetical protein
VVQGKFMLAKLRKNGTNIQVNFCWVRNRKGLRNCLFVGCVNAPILKLKSHLQIGKGISKLVSFAEVASKVIVGGCAHPFVLLGKKFSLLEKLKWQFSIVSLQSLHSNNVANKSYFIVY